MLGVWASLIDKCRGSDYWGLSVKMAVVVRGHSRKRNYSAEILHCADFGNNKVHKYPAKCFLVIALLLEIHVKQQKLLLSH